MEREVFNYPRVTEIIKATESKEKRKRLLKWEKTLEKIHGTEGKDRIKEEILQNGTDLHEAIAIYLYSNTHKDHPQFNIILPLLKIIEKAPSIFIEYPLFSHEYQFKGTTDLICSNFENKLTIFDWTTSKNPKRRAWIEHKFIQAGAYSIMAKEDLKLEPEQLCVVVVSQKLQIFDDSPKKWEDKFLERLEKFRYPIAKSEIPF